MSTKKKIGLSVILANLWDTIWRESGQSGNRFKRSIRKASRIIICSYQKFLQDEALLRASSICYSLVISFVPILVVAMLVGARIINIEEWFSFIQAFLKDNNIPIDPTPFFEVISDFLRNSAAIGSIGLLVLLFSATALLRNLEDALNKIWKIEKSRPLIQKISGFVMVMLFGPIFIAAGISLAQGILIRFSVPDFLSVHTVEQKTYVTGENASLMLAESDSWELSPVKILDHVDFDYDSRKIIFSSAREPLSPFTSDGGAAAKVDASYLKKSDFTDFFKYEKNIWVIGTKGILLHSRDNGETFYIRHFQRLDEKENLISPRLNQIYFTDSQRGFVIGDEGFFARTVNSGEDWSFIPLENGDFNLKYLHRLESGQFILLGSQSAAFISDDGVNWEEWGSLKGKSSQLKVDFLGVDHFSDFMVVVGSHGFFFVSVDGGVNWRIKSVSKSVDIRSVSLISERQGLIVGSQGEIRYTEDAGTSWKKVHTKDSPGLNQVIYHKRQKTFYAVGDEASLLKSKPNSLSAFSLYQKYSTKNLMVKILANLILPFLIIWLFFFLIYKIIPYAFVNGKAASIGAAFTSFAWVIFILGFKVYISSFSKGTFVIYGSLAAIPLFLLWFYASVLIMLFGVEISYFIQNPTAITTRSKSDEDSVHKKLWYALEALSILYRNHSQGKGAVPEKKLLKICPQDHLILFDLLEKLQKAGFIEETTRKGYLPSTDSKNILMKDILNILDIHTYQIPGYSDKNLFMRNTEDHFKKLRAQESKILSQLRLSDLLSGYV